MKKFNAPEQWDPSLLTTAPFSHLSELFNICQFSQWPSFSWLNDQANKFSTQTYLTHFIPDGACEDGRYYEQIIFETHNIPTREQNWHDFFGAMIWCLFPKTKALLNALHMQEINQHGLLERTKMRNALTLFDECGLVLAITDKQWQSALRNHQWKAVFYQHADCWQDQLKPFIFGHANYEMLTRPFIGLTAKVVCVVVGDAFMQNSLEKQYQELDSKLVTLIKNGLLDDNTQMSPLPLLGIPGWYEGVQDDSFYSNTDYFRPKRRK
ncbi:DUF3025 domain-containing protein [Pseudoalteromonas sp. T1lg65]|uniref:DUF3025 domain-containing protein n=1 Tax=Pseudoalteromonas sp. T1lg65 TaxID=2077101 RepID=UPI003F78FAF8